MRIATGRSTTGRSATGRSAHQARRSGEGPVFRGTNPRAPTIGAVVGLLQAGAARPGCAVAGGAPALQ